jgi:alginate O-acetyltransferase complex protein AlgI
MAVMATMVLGGLWHGAGWTFLLWGAGHGILMAINYLWKMLVGDKLPRNRTISMFYWMLTFLSVSILWVLFRSPDFLTAGRMLSAMFDPTVLPGFLELRLGSIGDVLTSAGWSFAEQGGRQLFTKKLVQLLFVCLFIVLAMPNFYDLMKREKPYLIIHGIVPENSRFIWNPSLGWALVFGCVFAYSAVNGMVGTSEFLYFQF